MERKIIQVQDKVPLSQWIPLSLQHLFAMFGASILVPIIFGIDPAIVLIMNGLGTLLFIWMGKGKAPAYLGSSFAFIAPAQIIMAKALASNPSFTVEQQFAVAQSGFVVVGLAGMLVAVIIWKVGTKWINIILPPAAMGPVVALIGLSLAGAATDNFGHLIPHEGAPVLMSNVWVFLITLGVAVFGSVCFRKFLSVIPILIAIVVGYIAAVCFGIVDFSKVADPNTPWLALPHVQLPIWDWGSILTMLPVLLVVITEHIGHQLVTSEVVGKDLIKDPGLHRTMMADYLSSAVSGFVGAVPTTTYGENIGVMAITKVYSVRVIGGAAVISMAIAFIGKFSALIQSIPGPVIGGVSFLLYGMIAAAGIRVMIDAKVDFAKSRNLVLTAVVFITGLSGVGITIGGFSLTGMTLATIVGMLLSLIFYILDKLNLTNDKDEVKEESK